MQENQKINMNFILKEFLERFILIELRHYIFYLDRKDDIYCF